MEAQYLSLAVLGSAAGVFALLPSARSFEIEFAERGGTSRFETVCTSVGEFRLVARVSSLEPVRVLCSEIQRLSAQRGFYPGEQGSAGLGTLLLLVIFLAGCSMSASLVGGVVVLVLACVAIPFAATSVTRRDARQLAQEMPQVFRTLASALGSGESLMQAIGYVGTHEKGRAAAEFSRAALSLRCGESVDEVLSELAERIDAPGIRLLTSALSISQRTGSPLAELLMRSARMVEQQEELQRMLSVKTAQARLSVKIVCIMPVLMVLVLSLASPDFQRGLTTLQGLVCVGIAFLMDGAALVIVRTLMKGVL